MLLLYLIQLLGDLSEGSVSKRAAQPWYSVSYSEGVAEWVELEDIESTKSSVLSSSYLSSGARDIPFDFPFYGEDVNRIAVTTQGFLYMGTFHRKLYETQYVAPLMANFRPWGDIPSQDVRDLATEEMFIVQWSSMLLEYQRDAGYFTFQTQLSKDGTIKFLYKRVPLSIGEISEQNHHVKVGISDAFVNFGLQAYETYDIIELKDDMVVSNSTITLNPLPSCIMQKSCGDCIALSTACTWCPSIKRCSSGQDKLFQRWTDSRCSENATTSCDLNSVEAASTDFATTKPFKSVPYNHRNESAMARSPGGMTIILILLIATSCIVIILLSTAIIIMRRGQDKKDLSSISLHTPRNPRASEGKHCLLSGGSLDVEC